MATKTPVSILQEMMVKRDRYPQYALICDGSRTRNPVFKYRVCADTVRAVGCGNTKKEAKHDAAKKALQRLALLELSSNVEQADEEGIEVISPNEDKVQNNAVSILNGIYSKRQIPLPVYVNIGETGPPHRRIFTCECRISDLKEVGEGPTKKEARRVAANNMLERLKEYLGDIVTKKDHLDVPSQKREKLKTAQKRTLDEATGPHSEDCGKAKTSGNLKKAFQTYVSKIASRKNEVQLNDNTLLGTRTLLNTPDSTVKETEDLRLLADTVENNASYWEDLVNTFAEKMQLTATWVGSRAPKRKERVKSKIPVPSVVIYVKLSSTPEFVVSGAGKTEEIARKKAAEQCLSFLQTMMGKTGKAEAKQAPDEVAEELEDLYATDAVTEEPSGSYWEDIVRTSAEKMQLTATWKGLTYPERERVKSKIPTPGVIIYVKLNSNPEFVVSGAGKTEEIARKEAAKQCLNFLQTMLDINEKTEQNSEPELSLKEEDKLYIKMDNIVRKVLYSHIPRRLPDYSPMNEY